MNREQLLYEMKNANQRSAGETLGGAAGGALRGALMGTAGAALPLLFSKLSGVPINNMNLASLGMGALGGGAMGGLAGAITGGGFAQGLDTGNSGLLGLPFEIQQGRQARKAKKLDELYNRLQLEGYTE